MYTMLYTLVCPSYILIMSMWPPYLCEPWPYFSYQYTLNSSCLLFQSSFIDAFWQAFYIMTCWVNCSVLCNWNEFSDTFVLNYDYMMLLSGVIETILCGLCWYRNVLYILWIQFQCTDHYFKGIKKFWRHVCPNSFVICVVSCSLVFVDIPNHIICVQTCGLCFLILYVWLTLYCFCYCIALDHVFLMLPNISLHIVPSVVFVWFVRGFCLLCLFTCSNTYSLYCVMCAHFSWTSPGLVCPVMM